MCGQQNIKNSVPEMFSVVGKSWYMCIESKGEYFEGDYSCNSMKYNKPF